MEENESQDITNIDNNEDIILSDDNFSLEEDYVLDWNKQEDDAIQDGEAEEVSLGEQAGDSEEVDGSLREESDQGEDAYEGESQEEEYVDDGVELGQVQGDEEYEDEEVEYEDDEYEDEAEDLPEDWSNLMAFLEDNPGATPSDYVKLTEGFDSISDEDALKMKLASDEGLDPIEDADEINFLYDDKFAYDEDLDSERDIRLRKIASKKALKDAKEHIGELKDKYGTDLKFKNESPEFKEAIQFQQEQIDAQQQQEELATDFQDRTKDFFTQDFKGFEFNYGDGKAQRIKVGDANKAAENQGDISNFIGKYLNDDGQISDMKGYHKSLWAAQNADALFSHAYEQGKADAVRSSAKNAKNIDMGLRQGTSEPSQQGRFKLEDEGHNTDNFKLNF